MHGLLPATGRPVTCCLCDPLMELQDSGIMHVSFAFACPNGAPPSLEFHDLLVGGWVPPFFQHAKPLMVFRVQEL